MKLRLKTLLALAASEDGSTATEYALLAVAIGVGIIVALLVMSGSTTGLYEYIGKTLQISIG